MIDIVRKVCMCGDPDVGKTSVVRRFVSGKYEDKYISTLGTHISRKLVITKKYNVRLMIWDISGQPEFKRIHNSAFMNSTGGLAVCDATRPETAENLVNWIENLRKGADREIPIVILANKTDLLEGGQGHPSEIELIADKYNCSLFDTSAKTGNNVEEAFKTLANSIASDVANEIETSDEIKIEEPNDIYSPTQFLDYTAISFCKVMGDEEMGMHIMRKQVKDEGFDFRNLNKFEAKKVITRLVPIIKESKGNIASQEFKEDLFKVYDKIRE